MSVLEFITHLLDTETLMTYFYITDIMSPESIY